MQTKTIFHQCKTSYNTGVVVQDNAAQQWWYTGSEHNFKYW